MRIIVAEAAQAFGSSLIKQKTEAIGAFRYKMSRAVCFPRSSARQEPRPPEELSTSSQIILLFPKLTAIEAGDH